MYRIEITPQAIKDLGHLPRVQRTSIETRIESLGLHPRPVGAIKLTGRSAYRLRVGDYRIIYKIDDAVLCVLVVRIGHRKEVYR